MSKTSRLRRIGKVRQAQPWHTDYGILIRIFHFVIEIIGRAAYRRDFDG